MSADRNEFVSPASPLARAIASALCKPGMLAAAAGMALSPAAFAATTYTVTNTNDNGAGSLRDAINQANGNPGADIVNFGANVSGTITLTTGSLFISDGVDIQGPGASVLTIDGSSNVHRPSAYNYYGSDVVIGRGSNSGGQGAPTAPLAATPVTLSGLTFSGGSAPKGGGIYAYYAQLTVNNCVVTGNTAYYSGGGIYMAGYSSLTLTNSVVSSNTAYYTGGGIATEEAAITIQQSSLTGNSASTGGGVFVHNDNSNALTITASTVSGNSATASAPYSYSGGGGVYAKHVSAAISNSTVANNSANRGGGVVGHISYSNYYSTTLSNSTVSGNSATNYGGGVSETESGPITLTNTVVAGNSARSNPDVSTTSPYYYNGNYSPGSTIAASFSLIGNTGSATITDNGGNQFNLAAQLGALGNNGGPTQTMLPLIGSPLIDLGDPAFTGPPNTDQRGAGFPRIINGRVDIGATEFGTGATAAVVPTPGLGLGGGIGLGALLGLAGLAVARRRRSLGTAAGILLAAGLCLSAPLPVQAAQGHESRQRQAVTITSYSVQGKLATIVLSNGKTITAPKWKVHTVDRRSTATKRLVRKPASVTSGTPAAVSYETNKNGKVGHVNIRLVDSLQQAQALLAKKP
ncbi:MAG: choice-of-anchor Q domain-containing protein [Rudaea sp.]